MAYFNHAFIKTFAPTSVASNGTKTKDLIKQEFGTAMDSNWETEDPAQKPFYLVQGAYTANDVIGSNPGHGGYTESIKSKMINPKYINRLYSSSCQVAQAATATLEVGPSCVPCGEVLLVRLDVKGSPALRFLNHNAYATGDSGNICCTAEDQEYIDPASALVEAVSQVISDPIVAPFVQMGLIKVSVSGVTTPYADLADFLANYVPSTDPVTAEISASIELIGAYVDTRFGNCSFDTRDFYEMEPVSLILSAIDETGDPCSDCGTSTSTPGVMAQTHGDTVLREVLMTENYRQSPYNQGNADSARMREIEGSDLVVNAIPRFDANGDIILYKTFVLQHVVPRFNNPSGVFDNDQYLYKVYVPCGDSTLVDQMDELWNLMSKAASSLGNIVDFEQDIDALV